ncbi:MAG: polysaccharide deacetylase family protein [Actinomycetes bacterium]|jgi:peptidoglycan/xylan/chitin deacetylase (PgdA/CDA1 family)|nr:polysaccharide deacetylase family protein [Actinomycetes bacterium]
MKRFNGIARCVTACAVLTVLWGATPAGVVTANEMPATDVVAAAAAHNIGVDSGKRVPTSAATGSIAPDVTVSVAATGSAATTPTAPAAAPILPTKLAADAKQLLFGKRGKSLTLKLTPTPASAETSTVVWKSSNKTVATVSGTGKVTARGWGQCTVSATVGDVSVKVPVTIAKKWVAVTWDDGPGKPTKKLLTQLRKRKVHCTFFVVGSMAKSKTKQKLLKQMKKDGHEIANHTWNHNGSAGALMAGLKKTDTVIKKAIGKKSTLMRPPGGAINSVTKRCGKAIIIWTVDPKDWRDRNANTVYKRVVTGTRSGSIVLLHDIHPTSVTGGIRAIDALAKKGYTFVTVTQLLGSPKKNKIYHSGAKTVRTAKLK